jgi:hypothetical protein
MPCVEEGKVELINAVGHRSSIALVIYPGVHQCATSCGRQFEGSSLDRRNTKAQRQWWAL